jgi:opacity protein-like surface antigen
MKKIPVLIALFLLVAAALPAAAQRPYYGGESSVRFSVGQYALDGDSQYWNDKFFDFTGQVSDFDDIVLGIDYTRRLGDRLRLIAGGSFYEGESDQAYFDFVDGAGNDIFHTTTLRLDTATVALAFNLAGPGASVIPYIGAGGGLYAWELEENGDFIDFDVFPPEIFSGSFIDDGVTLGWFWTAGIEVPVSSSFIVFAQGRWHDAEDDLSGDFQDLGKLDLSGVEVTGGFGWRF